MSWLKKMFSGPSSNESAVDFINKNVGVQIKIPRDTAIALHNEGQRLAREMDQNSFDKPRIHVYISPYTLIGEFNGLVQISEHNGDENMLNAVCEGIIIAFNKYREEFKSCFASLHLNVPTENIIKAQKKLKLSGIHGE